MTPMTKIPAILFLIACVLELVVGDYVPAAILFPCVVVWAVLAAQSQKLSKFNKENDDMSEAKDLLIRARARIAEFEHWTQGENATTHAGSACPPNAPEAYCWCARGALLNVSGLGEDVPGLPADHPYLAAYQQLNAASGRLFDWGVVEVNDGSLELDSEWATHKAVLQMYDLAIERAA